MIVPEVRRLCDALVNGGLAGADDDLAALARAHRVDLLLEGRSHVSDTIRVAAARELSCRRDIVEAIDAAQRAGVDVLLLKGAALAYTHYPEPHLRPFNDVDLFIRAADRDRAAAAVESTGYARAVETGAELWSGQYHFVKTTPSGRVMVDLHWRIANPIAFAEAVVFDEVWARSVGVPALGPHARTLSPADSLLLACLHRVAHHGDSLQLLWLWDIHLIASRMSPQEFDVFGEGALRARVAAVCSHSLGLAQECFGTAVPRDLMSRLGDAVDEPSAAFVGGPMSLFDVARADMAALSGWRRRAGLVREHLFPAPSYMRQKYADWPAALLPLAYVHRMIRGAPRWLRR